MIKAGPSFNHNNVFPVVDSWQAGGDKQFGRNFSVVMMAKGQSYLFYNVDKGCEIMLGKIRLLYVSIPFYRTVLVIILSDRIRNTTIRSKIGIVEVGNKTVSLKWQWAGHVWVSVDGGWSREENLDPFIRDWQEKTARRK